MVQATPGVLETPVASEEQGPVLEVNDLRVEFHLRKGVVTAVSGLSYSLSRGETLAIVGESGSGKSVAAHAVMGLLPSPPAFISGGTAHLLGNNLLTMTDRELRQVRGERIALVSQASSLNPVFSVGWQIAEPFRVHRGMSRKDAFKEAAELMDRVGIPSAKSRVKDYPHQFSGGQRQRASIAMAMALGPDVLIADEPTTALDVTVQAQIMALLADMQCQTGMGLILITHDLGLVSECADQIVVMYAGRECETGSARDLFTHPQHPYTRGLMRSIPSVKSKNARLEPIGGAPPDIMEIPAGCPFQPRCESAVDRCALDRPELTVLGPGRACACHRVGELS
jgi:oligopeptide transport system ATP-binding protein